MKIHLLLTALALLPLSAWGSAYISINNPAAAEGNSGTGFLSFTIARSGDLGSQLFLRFRTEDGTATAPSDYVSSVAGELVLAAGSTQGTMDIQINGDTAPEADETLGLHLTDAVAVASYLILETFDRFSTGNELLDLKPSYLALGDVNSDGRLDVVVANVGSYNLGILLNTTTVGASNSSFSGPTSFVGASALSLADLNGDGRPDIVEAGSVTGDASVRINTTTPGAITPSFSDPVVVLPKIDCGAGTPGIADINGDGRPDIVVPCSGRVITLVNNTVPGSATPSFSEGGRIIFAGGDTFSGLAVSDFNGDGRRDLALTNVGGYLHLLLNTTAPGSSAATFAAVTTLPVSPGATTVSAGDLNGDGRPDLVVARSPIQNDSIPSRVEVLFNRTAPGPGTPSFSPFISFNVVNTDTNASLADINGDGRLDIVVAMNDRDGSPISFQTLLNATPPGATAPDFRAGGGVFNGGWMIAHGNGDLNNDGRPDVALVAYSEPDRNLYVVLNATPLAGDPPDFRAAAGFAAGATPAAAAVADFNLDGRPDLVAANTGDDTLSLLAGMMDPGSDAAVFGAAASRAVGSQPIALLAVDLNTDGKPDLASANAGGNSVSILMNTGTPGAAPGFGAAATVAVGSAPQGLASGDFNGDGKVDLAVANNGSNTVSVLFNSTTPGAASAVFSSAGSPAVGTQPRAVAIADFNLDGKPDLATASAGDNTATVLLSTTAPGASSASFAAGSALAMGAKPIALAASDLNLDGKPDLVTADEVDGTVSVRFNTTAPGGSSAAFSSRAVWPAGATPSAVVLRDLDGDGKPEILVTDTSAGSVRVLKNNTAPGATSPGFASVGDFAAGAGPAGLAVADLNGDGQRDLVVANASDGTLSVLLSTLFTVTLENDTGIGTILDDDTDAVPDAFSFPGQTGVATGAVVVSAAITVSGINVPAPIAVTYGEYSVDGGAFTNTNGSVSNGQSVRLRHTAAATANSATNTTLTIGGVEGSFTSVTAGGSGPDTTPDAFSFTSQTGVAPDSVVISNAVTITGIDSPAPISVTGGDYSIAGGAFTSANGTVSNGQSVRLRHNAASTANTATNTVLTIGGVQGSFTSVTAPATDTVPNPFTFASRTGVARNATVVSDPITVSGINAQAAISVVNGEYSLDGGAYTAVEGTVTSGQVVRLRHVSASTPLTDIVSTLTIGGVSASFTSTTAKAGKHGGAWGVPELLVLLMGVLAMRRRRYA